MSTPNIFYHCYATLKAKEIVSHLHSLTLQLLMLIVLILSRINTLPNFAYPFYLPSVLGYFKHWKLKSNYDLRIHQKLF